MRPITLSLAAIALLTAAPGTAAGPAPEINAAKGLAVGGHDPVAYFRSGKPMPGSSHYQLSYKGAVWRFASAETLRQFQEQPEAFAPQFGGYCAWAVSQHYLAPGDPRQWKIVDGKLYLNANARAKELWEADQADAIVRGHANWPAVLTNNQDSR
jgi:YHS domain-containing protein